MQPHLCNCVPGRQVLSAEELGMDRETWELLLQLQHREINPNDYNVLLELDNRVEKPSLAKRKLRLFPTARVAECAGESVVVRVFSPPAYTRWFCLCFGF